jgi:hypothetical protein
MKTLNSGKHRTCRISNAGQALFVLALAAFTWTQGSLSPHDPTAYAQFQAQSAPSFARVVQENFTHWDLNHDGRLETNEIDQLMNRKGIHRFAAAALATIKRRERMVPDGERSEYAPSEEELMSMHDNEGPLQQLDMAQGKPKVYHFEAQYRHNLAVLGSINHKLYAGEGPDFAALHQGPIGDCYFFSVTGYLAACDPQRLMRMLAAEPNGGFLVRLGDGESLQIRAPTDAEILVNNSATSLEDGIWLTVLEKAIGRKMRLAAKPEKRTGEATDAMAHGGSAGKVIQWYTGHETIGIKLRDPAHAEARLAQLRELLPTTLEHRQLAALGMGKEPPPNGKKIPHLGYGHSYAIFGFNPQRDEVTVWNPWGNDVKPKGPAGVEYGFPTRHGIFQIPLATLYEQFSGVQLETSKPLPPDSAAPQQNTRN